jgi:hypothetical protein
MRWLPIVAVGWVACSKPADPPPAHDPAPERVADVKAVAVSGAPNDYTFAVTVASPDTGCDRYANWWEVVGEDGRLLYRRILRHSHVRDQPFERDGGPVPIGADTRVFVRAHMHPGGYGGVVMVGTPADGFGPANDLPELDPAIESAEPQPRGCDH